MAELVDALDSKSSGSNIVWVQVPPQAPLGNLFELEIVRFYMFLSVRKVSKYFDDLGMSRNKNLKTVNK